MARKKLIFIYLVRWVGKDRSYSNVFRKKDDAMCFMIKQTDVDELSDEELKMTDEQYFEMIERHNVFPLSNYNQGAYYFELEKLHLN